MRVESLALKLKCKSGESAGKAAEVMRWFVGKFVKFADCIALVLWFFLLK